MTQPILRNLDIFPIEEEGQPLVGLADPEGISDQVLAISPPVLLLLQYMDGEHDLDGIQAAVLRDTGQAVALEQIEGVVRFLDEALFLEGPTFERARQELRDQYLALPLRPANLAGRAYPDDPEALKALLDGFYDIEGGPGGVPTGRAAASSTGLIAPHIDFERGGPAYAHAYRALAEQTDARLFVVFGTSHAGCEGHFGFTRMGYDTPLGPVPCDTELVNDIVARCDGEAYFAGELAHRTEHSIEFQAVYLRHLFPEAEDLRIVPILCGHFDLTDPADAEEIQQVLDAVREALDARGEPAVVIAGADLAHIGPRFGDPESPSEAALHTLEGWDRDALKLVCAGDARGFYDHVEATPHNRVCGLSPIYATLDVTRPARGELLAYGQAEDPTGPSTVSFASVTLYGSDDTSG